jgi:hypothetical protein
MENIVDGFDRMRAEDKSQSFSFLIGLLWGLNENLRKQAGLSNVLNMQQPTLLEVN